MQNGLALQAGTSHDLGQNFGKAFDVQFQSKEGKLEYQGRRYPQATPVPTAEVLAFVRARIAA